MKYLLDSCVLLSYILGEKEALRVKELLEDASHQFHLNYINYGEVLFSLGKKGFPQALMEETKIILKQELKIKFLKTDDFASVELAAEIKTEGGLSYFDSLILASSRKHDLIIITKDQEFQKFTKDFDILFL